MEYINHALTAELEHVSSKVQRILFEMIFQHATDMVYLMKVEEGPRFRYLFVNESGLKRARMSLESIGKTLEEALPHEQAVPLKREYEKVMKKKDVLIYSDYFYIENGAKVYGETVLTPVKDESSAVRYIVAITRDVTEKHREKNELLESEQRYRSIVDNNLDAIFSISLDGQLIEANPAAAKLTGFTKKQLAKRSIYDFIADRDLASFKSILERTADGYALETLDCRLVHSNGRLFDVHLKTVPIVVNEQISGLYIICRDISEQAKNVETIKFMVLHDQLTGLRNRRALIDDLNKNIRRFSREKKAFSLISIDLDRFKYLNDSLGHLVGDEILKRVSQRLIAYKSKNCFVYRQGGDEFNLLLLNVNRIETNRFVQGLIHNFSKSFYFNSQEYFISPSIGISMYPSDGKDAETLIKNADEALFRVKERGRGHYQFYRSDMNAVLTNVVALETHLRKAIELEELTLYFQPQINLRTREIKSFEALLRWNNEELGMISPNLFIPLAEDTGLMISIGNWVIEKACWQIREWNRQGFYEFRVAINISPKQFQQPNLVGYIAEMMKKYEVHPAFLEIEITEGAMQDTKEAIPILQKIKELGIKISVDDFGTGYSSLSYLKQFPIDVLKIDQSFIRDLFHDEKDAAITSTIIHLGQSLGMEVVAEGVETIQQVEFLINANCHKAQGYFYAKPIPPNEVEERFLRKRT
ncbi:sensor domain-containing protein [Neobacillus sp. SM06]|uniref:sensor domain-containing protein n=1 Tax=Neobacillus sp. SM06 TaxID=3422492 RepID=UPI003D2C91A4